MSDPSDPRKPADAEAVAEAIGHLRSLLSDAIELAGAIEARGPGDPEHPAPKLENVHELQRRLDDAEKDQEDLTERLVEAERQAGKLTSLYVATYQLHVSLDPVEVSNAIAEIARDLLGAKSFALLIKDDIRGGCEVALTQGLEDDDSLFSGETYDGGDPQIDTTLKDGVLRLEPLPGSRAIAIVPLRVEEATVGALVLLEMLEHKATPVSEDRDILDLLAAHAASALFAARVYSKTDRKLRTLEGLVGLIRQS